MDIEFPFKYSNGSIKVVDTSKEKTNQAKFLLSTIKGERYLFPAFGVNYGILFRPQFFAAVKEDISNDLSQLSTISSEIDLISEDPGLIKLQVTIKDGENTEIITRILPG